MGRVTCKAKVENAIDAAEVRQGKRKPTDVRTVEINDALVDTGASTLALPTSLLRQLGLDTPTSTKRSRNTTGEYVAKLYGPVRLWIDDRDITLDALEVEDGCPVLIGQIPLEHMQYVVDMTSHRLVPSSANGGEWILDMYSTESKVMPLTEAAIYEAYTKLGKTRLEHWQSSERLSIRRMELAKARSDKVHAGLIDGKNEAEREAKARHYLNEEFIEVELAEIEEKRFAIAVELCKIEIDRIQTVLRYLSLPAKAN